MTDQDMLLYCLTTMWLLAAVTAVMYRNMAEIKTYYVNIIDKLLEYIDIEKLDLDLYTAIGK